MKITLCGSMRFNAAYGDWDVILSKAGHIVYSRVDKHPDTPEEKRRFDLLHLKKISESDAILVLNKGGYYGESTEREIEWARMERKDVYWLENTNNRGEKKIMGPSVWTLYNLFDGGLPINSIKETEKYQQEAIPNV